ncbi:unnamed protein product [Allacma fusca]|uniref:C2H2-type domain-containing protein n=1 Tax=Allacma fusca TaxID=39272 RepID=A0A8J2PLE1_9HEXA|nr:unnamed protein product [Allacma fusca]
MGSLTSDSNPINFENIWYVCKYCRRAYQQKHQLSEHKKAKHLDLILKAYNERKLKKKLEEEKLAGVVPENDNTETEPTSSPAMTVPQSPVEEPEDDNEEKDVKPSQLSRLPILASLDAASAKQEGIRREESDSEIEIVFDSHRPLASPMKPLSPCTVDADPSQGKKRRHSSSSWSSCGSNSNTNKNEIISLNTPEYATLDSITEIVSKIGVLGKVRYCCKCFKKFHRPKSLRSHEGMCHLKKCRSLEEFKASYQIQMVSSRGSSTSYPTLVEIQPLFNCKLCGASFHEKLELTSHLRYHMDKKTRTVLPKKKKRNLKQRIFGLGYRHYLHRKLQKHDAELKPFRCPCLKSPSVQGLIKRARFYRYHTQGALFRCPMCSQKFRSKAEFSIHVKSHEKKRVRRNLNSEGISCKLCEKTFRDMATLLMHLRNHSFSPLKFPEEIMMC